MADELVYRIVLDGQDESSGSSRPFPSSPSRSPRTIAEEDPMAVAYRTAQARRERENAAELADQVYRAMRRGVKPSVIEDEDHQAKLDKQEAEQEAIREKARKEAERQAELAQRRQIAAEERQARDEDWLERDQIRQRDQEAARKLRDEERQERDEDWYARDQIRQQREAESERAKQAAEEARAQKEKQSQDPVFLAQQAIDREKLMERTRLQYEATKRGVTPEQIANEERARESARAMSGNLQTGAGLINSAISGGPLGLLKGLGGLHSILSPITSTVSNLAGAAFESAGQIRETQLRAARFSPEVIMARIENRIKELMMDLDFSRNKGPEVAARERELGALDRISKGEDLNANAGVAAVGKKKLEIIGQRARNDFFKLVDGLTDLLNDPVEFITRDLRVKPAPNPIANRPGPFQFVADRAFQSQVRRRQKEVRGMINDLDQMQKGMQLPGQ